MKHACVKHAALYLALPDAFMKVDDLISELLHIYQTLSRNSSFLVLQPAVMVGRDFEDWSAQEDEALYHLLMLLNPPSGHTSHLEPDNTGEMLAKDSCIRVELECTCRREELAGHMLCFVHHPEERLRRKQAYSLLRTLCSSPYPHQLKTTHWFQMLVRAAWRLLP